MASKKPDVLSEVDLRRLYVDEAWSQRRIAQHAGLSPASVLYRLRRAGIATFRKPSRVDDSTIRSLAEEGLHQAAIARQLGCSDALVKLRLAAMGIRAADGHTAGRRSRPRYERVRARGYWMLYRPDHPYASKRGYIMEHRVVIEAREGRYLLPGEVVHHMNHVKDDNRPENLMLLEDQAAHGRLHRPVGDTHTKSNAARWRRLRAERGLSTE